MAITRSKRSAWRGANKLRKTLKRIEPDITQELKTYWVKVANEIADIAAYIAYSKGLYREGDMIESIEVQMGRDGLTAVIGPGAKRIRLSKSPFDTTLYIKDKDKHAALQFFKAYWAEFGTKGAPSRNIPPQVPTPFMNPAYDSKNRDILKNRDRIVHKVLIEVTRGTTDG